MAARHLLIPFAGWHVEHGFDSDPNWRVQEGKGIYIEITIYLYIFNQVLDKLLYVLLNISRYGGEDIFFLKYFNFYPHPIPPVKGGI